MRFNGAFEGIVSRSLFEKAQQLRAQRAKRLNNDEIVEVLRGIFCKHGRITSTLIDASGPIKRCAVKKRFGSLITAYARVGYRPSRNLDFLAHNDAARRLRDTTARSFEAGLLANGASLERLNARCRFLINGEVKVSITVAQQRRSKKGHPRWHVKAGGSDDDLTIAVLMDGTQERARAYFFVPASELGNGPILALRNRVDVEAFRFTALEPLLQLFRRRELEPDDAPLPTNVQSVPRTYKKLPRALRGAKSKPHHYRSFGTKSYTGSFLRASKSMRAAIVRADSTQSRLNLLRQTLARLVNEPRFIRLLLLHGFSTLPMQVVPKPNALRKQEESFRANLRAQALALLSGPNLRQRVRDIFDRLIPTRRVEVVECMVLTNDYTEYFALALVAATPPNGLAPRPRKHVVGPTPNEFEAFIEEGDLIYHETKRAMCLFGRNSL